MPRKLYNVADMARTDRGDYVRYVGKLRGGAGVLRQAKFYLGRDARLAQANRIRLEQLWSRVVEDTPIGTDPEWDPVAHDIAKAVSRGEVGYRLPRRLVPFGDEETYVHYVGRYAQLSRGVVEVSPEDDESYAQGIAALHSAREDAIRKRIDPAFPPAAGFPAPALPVNRPHETLHRAIDGLVAELDGRSNGDRSSWLGTQARQLLTLKEHHADLPLARLDREALRAIADHWMSRPNVKGKTKPVAPSTAVRHWERMIAVLKWASRSPRYEWRLPIDVLDDIRFRARRTPEDDAKRLAALRSKSWPPAQLAVVYRHATPLVRAVILLGLNCGYYACDIAEQLDGDDSFALGQPHPNADYLLAGEADGDSRRWQQPRDWMFAVRTKTGVPGEWLLWPHTVRAIRWARLRKRRLGIQSQLLLPTERGTSFVAPSEGGNRHDKLSKKWKQAWTMAVKENPTIPWRPLSSLRDTAADLTARQDEAAAKLMIRHGRPFRDDSLLELYAGRPFLRLHHQIERLHGLLTPLWEAVPDPFPSDSERD